VIYEENIAVLAKQNCLPKGLGLQCRQGSGSFTWPLQGKLQAEWPIEILYTVVLKGFLQQIIFKCIVQGEYIMGSKAVSINEVH
jgi:hypothetical protein